MAKGAQALGLLLLLLVLLLVTSCMSITIMTNPHLGLINGPPPYFVFLKNGLCHYVFTIKQARHIINSGQDFVDQMYT